METADKARALALQIPVRVLAELNLYVQDGVIPGKFLRAVINNDLQAAINEADEAELDALKAIVQYLPCGLPSGCHGYSDAIINWSHRKLKERANAARS